MRKGLTSATSVKQGDTFSNDLLVRFFEVGRGCGGGERVGMGCVKDFLRFSDKFILGMSHVCVCVCVCACARVHVGRV